METKSQSLICKANFLSRQILSIFLKADDAFATRVMTSLLQLPVLLRTLPR